MRKILKMFYGWHHSHTDFDQQRVFNMASQLAKIVKLTHWLPLMTAMR